MIFRYEGKYNEKIPAKFILTVVARYSHTREPPDSKSLGSLVLSSKNKTKLVLLLLLALLVCKTGPQHYHLFSFPCLRRRSFGCHNVKTFCY
jgi:hypothetical protein